MSRVFLADEVALNRRVVVKVLPPDLAAGVNTERFRREIQVAATLQHPHIVPLLTAGQAGDLFYYIMPYVEGESLRAPLDRDEPLSIDAAVRVAVDVAGALAYAHARGVIHRDIKPDNVLLAGDHALVTDFGVAKALQHEPSDPGRMLTSAGVALGTPTYMAPEQASGDPNVDRRADLYGLGVLLYEMLAGRTPFRGANYQQVLAAQLTQKAEAVDKFRPDTPPGLALIVMRCLEKDPDARWQTAGELQAALRGVLTPGATVALQARTRPVPAARRWAVAALAVVALAGSLWAWRTLTLREGASPDVIAVLPFTVRGAGELAYLGEGMVNLLSTSLDGAGALRSADPRAVLGLARRGGGESLDPNGARAIAQRLGAGLYVLGDVVQAGDRVRLDATLYRAGHAPTRATVEGAADAVFSLVDQLAARLLLERGGPDERANAIAAVTTTSLPALKAYLEGDEHFRAGRFAEAVGSFETAVGLDSTFALAYYRLSVAAEWALRTAQSEDAAEQAVRHASRLSAHDMALLGALQSSRHGDVLDAERKYRAILALHPDDVEAWLQLGEIMFHDARLFGRPFEASREPFERLLSFEPDNPTALVHLARIAARAGDRVATDTLSRHFVRINPVGERAIEVEALRVALVGNERDWERFLPVVRAAPDPAAAQVLTSILIWTDEFAALERFLAELTAAPRAAETQAVGHIYLAYVNAWRGRWSAARVQLDSASVGNPASALLHRALLSAQPFFPVSRDTLERLRAELTRWNAAAVPPSPFANAHFDVHDALYPQARVYLLGLIADRLGDTAAVLREAERLARMPGTRQAVALGHRLSAGLRARVMVAQRPDSALTLVDAAARQRGFESSVFSPIHSMSAERYWAGLVSVERGRTDQARMWLGSFEDFSAYDRVFEAPARLARARYYDRLGQADSAAADYERFLFLWADPDPELRPLVESARARLAALLEEDH